MKKKSLILFIIFLFTINMANAKSTKAIALKPFSIYAPTPTYQVKILEDYNFKNKVFLKEGSIISGQVISLHEARIGKRDSYFEILLTSISTEDGIQSIDDSKIVIKVLNYEPVDPKKIVGIATKNAVGFVFKGASQGISFVQGATAAPEGMKIESGLRQMYNDSFLSFIEVGDNVNFDKGIVVRLKFKELK